MIRSFFVPARLFRRFSHESTGGGPPDKVKKIIQTAPKEDNKAQSEQFLGIFRNFQPLSL